MLVAKIHSSRRIIVAICDSNLVGRKLEQDIRELNVRENFFKDIELSYTQALDLIKKYAREDATFNIVGHNAVKAALEAQVISKDGVATIQGVPFALVLL